jgi:hypothetical protein
VRPRCDHCMFWQLGPYRIGARTRSAEQKKQHPDDRDGTCRRYAPRPTLGEFEYELLRHLTTLAWDVCSKEERSHEFENWDQAARQRVQWPVTGGGDWCGEFKPKGKQ